MADFVVTMTGLQAAADNPELPDDIRQLALDARELIDTLKKTNEGFGLMYEEMETNVVETMARVDSNARLSERAKMGREFGGLGMAQPPALTEATTTDETDATSNELAAMWDGAKENDEPQD